MGETEEKENKPNESGKTETDEPRETEKLLNNDTDASKKVEIGPKDTGKSPEKEEQQQQQDTKETNNKPQANGEEIINIPEAAVPVTEEGREVRPKKIPIGGIKMPGFFTKNKPKTEGDGADGELLENAGNEAKAEAAEQTKGRGGGGAKGFFTSLRLPFFRNKPQPLKNETDETEEGREAKPEEAKTEGEQPPPKKGLLNAIRLPIANIIPKKLKPVNGGRAEDLEMGNGPNNKAGLASMETLDDSLKDTENGKDVPDRSIPGADADALESVKLNESKENGEKEKDTEKAKEIVTQKQTCLERIRSYQCSVDDMAIAGGVLFFFLLVAIICAFTFTGSSELTSSPLRHGRFIDAVTSCGLVEGMLEDSAFAFRGIPYAVPPIGEDRWKPARLVDNINDCWNDTFKAHNATPPCVQILDDSSTEGVEDCLNLDVITPHVRYDNPLPVVILIGAETLIGNSPSKLRPSARFSRNRDVIFVRPNFRMGVFGFLALNALSKSMHPPTSGNYALSDILAVLKWVNLNIEHFGGDPNTVTLFGHRAGATLVSALVTSPEAKGLFARAWVSSGSALFPGRPLQESERANEEYLNQSKCKDAECLRDTDENELFDAVPDTWRRTWPDLPSRNENTSARHEWLVLDGHILLKHPADTWNREPGAPKMVIGTTAHEAHSEKLYLKHKEWTPELVRKHVEESKIGELGLAEEAFKRYNATYQGLVSMISDIRTICPLLTMARQQPSVPFYIVTQTGGQLGIADVDADIQAILGRYEGKSPEQRRYISAIQQLFYHYVSHGEMKQFEVRRRVLDIGQDALPAEDYRNCDFWISKDVVPRYARLD